MAVQEIRRGQGARGGDHDRQLKAIEPPEKKAGTVRLGQQIADFIYAQPNKAATQRQLRCRFQGPVDELENLQPWLQLNYGIECRQASRKNQIVYCGKMNSSRGRWLGV